MKKLQHTIIYTFFMFTFIPLQVHGQTFKDAVSGLGKIVWGTKDNPGGLMALLFAGALALFIWGVVDFIRTADNPEERKKGKTKILWGIIALVAMVGYLGLTSVFTNTLFGSNASVLPQLCDEESC